MVKIQPASAACSGDASVESSSPTAAADLVCKKKAFSVQFANTFVDVNVDDAGLGSGFQNSATGTEIEFENNGEIVKRFGNGQCEVFRTVKCCHRSPPLFTHRSPVVR